MTIPSLQFIAKTRLERGLVLDFAASTVTSTGCRRPVGENTMGGCSANSLASWMDWLSLAGGCQEAPPLEPLEDDVTKIGNIVNANIRSNKCSGIMVCEYDRVASRIWWDGCCGLLEVGGRNDFPLRHFSRILSHGIWNPTMICGAHNSIGSFLIPLTNIATPTYLSLGFEITNDAIN